MLAGLRVNKLSCDSKLVAVLAYAAFDHVADAQFFSDLPDIESLVLVGEGGTAGDHHQVRESRERRDDVFSHPVAQIAKVLVGAQIIERKDGDGGNSSGYFMRRRSLLASNLRSILVPKFDLRCVCALR